MNELNRLNIEKASEYLAKVEGLRDFIVVMALVSKSDDVRAFYDRAFKPCVDLIFCLRRCISEQLVEEYN